jgi:hypothetical protein
MQRLLAIIGATILGWLGWWLGDMVGLMTAFVVSTVAAGIGWYIGTRIFQEYF